MYLPIHLHSFMPHFGQYPIIVYRVEETRKNKRRRKIYFARNYLNRMFNSIMQKYIKQEKVYWISQNIINNLVLTGNLFIALEVRKDLVLSNII